MNWSSTLRPASFRGVSFGVLGAQKEYGRRVITHVFPLRDQPFHEDMGRHPRAFSIDAFIVGHDVLARAHSLEAALEQKGPGTLVHPYYGAISVVALKSASSFVAYEGRVARFQIAFEEASTATAPVGVVNTIAALLSAAGIAVSSVLDAVVGAVSIARQVAHVRASYSGDFQAAATGVRHSISGGGFSAAAARLGAVVSVSGSRPMAVPAAIERLSGTSADDLGSGSEVAELVAMTIRALALLPTPVKMFSTERDENVRLVDTIMAIAGSVPGRAGSQLEATNRAAVSLLVDASAAASAVEVASSVVWDSRNQLDLYAARIAATIDAAADAAGALGMDQPWRDLCDLGATWSQHVARQRAPLPQIRKLILPEALPASLLAYRLDGNDLATVFGRGGSIARRNTARHPGFLPGGEELEVVANG